MRTSFVCDQAAEDGGGHPEGLCDHWMCSECQLDYTGPVYCPCGIDDDEATESESEVGVESDVEEGEWEHEGGGGNVVVVAAPPAAGG